ncbi:hypothetical protein [uncultured Methanobrevibacter sp.]|jgi:hypothetical protein|uniref:hypothetical protein n=1 Tax=uncultured Methanobrevibacter sp. TaxID=253161 RepID=UPI0025E7F02A|nr:hypothetical protein [uncultured Methanobrevibacter sp.]
MRRVRRISRSFEMLIGIVGSIIGMFSGSFLIVITHFNQGHIHFFGLLAIIASVLGLASSYYVKKNSEVAGLGFILAAVLVILSSEYINVLGSIFLLIAGISALFRK